MYTSQKTLLLLSSFFIYHSAFSKAPWESTTIGIDLPSSQSSLEQACSHLPLQSPVTAWPDESCSAPNPVEASTLNPYPLSCPPHPHKPYCFSTWEPGRGAESVLDLYRWLLRNDYRSQPLRHSLRRPATLGYVARSINLDWPEGMVHAVFYTDEECGSVNTILPEAAWHVERKGEEQCEKAVGGVFRSIEFMGEGNWKKFKAGLISKGGILAGGDADSLCRMDKV